MDLADLPNDKKIDYFVERKCPIDQQKFNVYPMVMRGSPDALNGPTENEL